VPKILILVFLICLVNNSIHLLVKKECEKLRKKIAYKTNFSISFWKFMVLFLVSLSTLLFAKTILNPINSYFGLGLLGLLAIFSVFIINCFMEFESMFITSTGGIYEYIKQIYNRAIGFLSASILIFGGYFFFTVLLFNVIYSNLVSSAYLSFFITFFLISIIHIISYKFHKFEVKFLVTLGILSFIFFMFIFLLSLSNFDLVFPVYKALSFNYIQVILVLCLILFFSITPLTFFTAETLDFEEYLLNIYQNYKYIIWFIIPIFLFVFSGTIASGLGSSVSGIFGSLNSLEIDISLLYTSNHVLFLSLQILKIFFVYFLSAVWFMGLIRLFVALSYDGLFFKKYLNSKKKEELPLGVIKFQFITIFLILCLVFLFYINIFSLIVLEAIIRIILMLFLLVFILIILGIFIFRKKDADRERPFAVKYIKISLVIGIILSILFLYQIFLIFTLLSFLSLLLFFLVIFIIYLLFEYHNNEQMVGIINDYYAYPSMLIEKIVLNKRIQSILFDFLGTIKGKSILEYGCFVGGFTLPLLSQMGLKSKLYVTDISNGSLKILKKRLEKHHHLESGLKIKIFKTKPSTINPGIPKVNTVLSIGTVSYVDNIKQLLREMNLILPPSGKIVIMDYNKLFGFIPNKWLNNDDTIKSYFDSQGFGVQVIRERRWFVEYVIIQGIKFKNAYYMDTWYSSDTFE
jgi:amino acid transporter/ubiquinone/menaquinone biosynthesis C-methylase UbiE